MTGINAVTLIVAEPSAVAARLAEAFGWEVSQDFGMGSAWAQVAGGPIVDLARPTA